MAKKDKDKEKEEQEKEEQEGGKKKDKKKDKNKGKKKKGCLINIIIFAIIMGALIWILGFNGLNIRDKYLRSSLEKVPIINKLLPPIEEPTKKIQETPEAKDQKEIDGLTKKIQDLEKEITRLKAFEKAQAQFKKEKAEFDQKIALENSKEYAAYYEKIAPENAEKLYKEAVNKNVKDKKFKEYIKTFESMKKDAVATVLEELLLTDTDLVITILENVSSDKRAEILSAMKPENAAICSKLLSPK